MKTKEELLEEIKDNLAKQKLSNEMILKARQRQLALARDQEQIPINNAINGVKKELEFMDIMVDVINENIK